MSSDDEPSCYLFRNPVPPSIYPFITNPDTTLSLLLEINASLPLLKRLPMEILLHVNEELHRENALRKEIRTIWTPVTKHDDSFRDVVRIPSPFHKAKLDMDTMQYYIPKDLFPQQEVSHSLPICRHMTPADFLYRLKCFFPDILWYSARRSSVWAAVLRHNQTGLFLSFTERVWSVSATHHAYYDRTGPGLSFATKEAIFSMHSVRLLNALFETVDGSRRMAYYHPVADADLPTGDERYVAVPTEIPQRSTDIYDDVDDDDEEDDDDEDDGNDEDEDDGDDEDEDNNDEDNNREDNNDEDNSGGDIRKARRIWKADDNRDYPITALDPDENYTLLQDLKYDIQSGKTDCLNGTVNLTTVISSALLLYRLLRTFRLRRCGKGDVQHSVWQVRLVHRRTDSYLVFMDDRGLFDIRAGTDVKGIMGDIRILVEFLCSDVHTLKS